MSAHRPRRIGRGAAERMLHGGPVNAGAGADPLADLLAAAAVPARDRELDGEEAAVAAFREARLAHVTQPRRKSVIKMLLARLLTMKVAALAAGATVIGGAAVAASTGVLPGVGGGGSATASPTFSATYIPLTKVPQADASVSASLLALCHSYTAAGATDASAALASPAMSALVSAAGGTDKVGPFCVKALRAEGGGTVTPGADAGADAGPGGAGIGLAASPGASVTVDTEPTGTGIGAQVPGAGVGASAEPQGAGGNVVPGAGANAGASGAGVSAGGGVSAGAPVHR